jgi:predicted ArsR family transcriptional regulator
MAALEERGNPISRAKLQRLEAKGVVQPEEVRAFTGRGRPAKVWPLRMTITAIETHTREAA